MEAGTFLFILAGYIMGSILFAPLFGRLLEHKDITEGTVDENPGVANAFMQGGFWCGVLSLCGDVLKGFLPVFFCLRLFSPQIPAVSALVVAAPVAGHIFPIFSHFRGGKGITTSFGCLLGLMPDFLPLMILALTFIFFSVIIRIYPHYFRTIVTYLCALGIMIFFESDLGILLGFGFIVIVVLIRLLTSQEEKEKMKVNLLWKH